jgi:predicted Zn-dependent protease
MVLLAALAACGTIDETLKKTGLKDRVESETGVDADPVLDAGKSLRESFEEITPEQEYWIGRAVAAEVLATTPVLDDDAANAYVNRVGQAVAQASDRPEVFGGYHFFILDTADVNALAAPGAFIFVTRGLLKQCRTEDELAAVLAHEVMHVANRHGVEMIRTSKRADALVDLGVSQAMKSGDVAVLGRALDDMAAELAGTLVKHGYSRSLERASDAGALVILARVGYRTRALPELLARLDAGEGGSLLATHESLVDRRTQLEAPAARYPERTVTAERKARFDAALAAARS